MALKLTREKSGRFEGKIRLAHGVQGWYSGEGRFLAVFLLYPVTKREDNLGYLSRKTLKLGYPWLSLKSAQLYPYWSLLIPTYTDLYQRGISRDISLHNYKNLILVYPKTTFLSRVLLGYPWVSHSLEYPCISLYKSGYGMVSFFQMYIAYTMQHPLAIYIHLFNVLYNIWYEILYIT